MPSENRHARRRIADADESAAVAASQLAEAFAHPLRVQIIAQLTKGPGSATTISDALDFTLSNVSYHLNDVLFKRCRVVAEVETVKRRGAKEKVYRLDYDRFLVLAKDAGPLVSVILAATAAGGDDGPSNGMAALHVGTVGAGAWTEITAGLDAADARISSEIETGSGRTNVIFGVAALKLPKPSSSEGS